MIHQNQEPDQHLCEPFPVPGPDIQEKIHSCQNVIRNEIWNFLKVQRVQEDGGHILGFFVPVGTIAASTNLPSLLVTKSLHETPEPALLKSQAASKQGCKVFLVVPVHGGSWRSWDHMLTMSTLTVWSSIIIQPPLQTLRNHLTSRIY